MELVKSCISTVRLKNFLSFYEGTVELDPGLTVIIGPNGSGKTSIFHAIKFALGSNQREDRYQKWGDFIRHGAHSAEVEVTVGSNGQDRKFLRRIDRKGVPRAYVDGRKVRAGELRNLVGALGFDIDNTLVFMPQERINALRDMDPIEVRKLIEEGTGLSPLRDRIGLQETEVAQHRQKLEAALNESKAVEQEINLLQRDLDRLEKKRSLQKEERELQIEVKWSRMDDIDSRLKQTKGELKEKNAVLVGIRDEEKKLKQEQEENENSASQIERRLTSIDREIAGIEAQIDEQKRLMRRLEDESKKALAEINQLQRHLKEENKRQQNIKEELERIVGWKEGYMEQREQIREDLDAVDIERTRIEDELAAFSEWNAQRVEALGTLKALQAEVKAKDVLMRSLRERMQIEEADLQRVESKWSSTWESFEDVDEKELARRKASAETEMHSLNEERFRYNSQVSQLQKEIADIKISLSETSERIPDSVKELKAEIKDAGLKSVTGPLVEVLKGTKGLSMVVEALLSQEMAFAFIVGDKADHSLVQGLRDKLDAPAPLIFIDTSKLLSEQPDLPTGKSVMGWLWDLLAVDDALKRILRHAFGDIVVTKTGRSAMNLATRFGLSAISQQGHMIMPEPNRIVSQPVREPTGIVSTAPLESRLAKLEKNLTITRKKASDVMAKLDKVANEREEIMDLQAQITRWSSTWETRKKLLNSIPELQENIVSLDEELKQLQAEVGTAERSLRKLDSSQPPERSRLMGQQSAIRMKQKQLQSELAKTERALTATGEDETSKRQALREVERSVTILSEQLTDLKEEIKTSKGDVSSILEKIENLKLSLNKSEQVYSTLKEELDGIRAVTKTIGERLIELSLLERNSRLEVAQTTKMISNLEQERESIGEDLSGLKRPTRVRDLDTSRQDLLRVRYLLDDYQDVSESIAHTENRLKSRLEELVRQVRTIKEELEEAEETVRDIREQYHRGMNEALAKVEKEVNDILSSVGFPGQTRFELVPLETTYGVEFRSKIRGEEFGSIREGSGGERSLIAISLILALQRFNPAPTYALDEIDIFLDATNTEMVARLLYDSSRRSQFILFTPAKSTHLLKHADKRIGVVSPRRVDPSMIIESPKFTGQTEA